MSQPDSAESWEIVDDIVARLTALVPDVHPTAGDNPDADIQWLVQQTPAAVVYYVDEPKSTDPKDQTIGCGFRYLGLVEILFALSGMRPRDLERIEIGVPLVAETRKYLLGYRVPDTESPLIVERTWVDKYDEKMRIAIIKMVLSLKVFRSNLLGAFALIHRSLFDDVDGTPLATYTPDLGNPWTVHSGAFEIDGGQCLCTDSTGQYEPGAVAVVECGASDVRVSVDLTQSETEIGISGVIWRYVDQGNFWAAIYQARILAFRSLLEYQAGVGFSRVTALDVADPTIPLTATITVVATGDDHSARYEYGHRKVDVLEYSGAGANGTACGLNSLYTAVQNRFDDFEVWG